MDREKQRRRTIGYHVATECSFTKRNYLWHVQGPEKLMVKGETVEVRKKNGEIANVTLGEVIERFMYAGSKVAVCKIDHSNRRDSRGKWVEKPKKSRSTRKGIKPRPLTNNTRRRESEVSAGLKGPETDLTSGTRWEWELDLSTECVKTEGGAHNTTKYFPGANGKKYRCCKGCKKYQFVDSNR